MKRLKRFCLVILALFMLLPSQALAHSGRTDSRGGHKDNKNVSGLGSYHYHCGGNPAHLHTNGVCPYAAPAAVKATPPAQTISPSMPAKMATISDIDVFIEDDYIPSLVYDDRSYVIVEDLANYGFDVEWDEASRQLILKRAKGKAIQVVEWVNMDKQYAITNSDIKTMGFDQSIGTNKQLESLNIGGKTMVKLTDLEIFGTITWESKSRTTNFTFFD